MKTRQRHIHILDAFEINHDATRIIHHIHWHDDVPDGTK